MKALVILAILAVIVIIIGLFCVAIVMHSEDYDCGELRRGQMPERAVGEEFKIHGITYQVQECAGCGMCSLNNGNCVSFLKITGCCSPRQRSDGKSVVFVKVQ